MDRAECYNYNATLKRNLVRYWNEWDWEVYCTLNLPWSSNPVSAVGSYVHFWVEKIYKGEGIDVGCVGIMKDRPEPHVRLLMLSDHNGGKSLADIGSKRLAAVWYGRMRSAAVVKKVKDQDHLIPSIIGVGPLTERYKLITPYNNDLLMRQKAAKLFALYGRVTF